MKRQLLLLPIILIILPSIVSAVYSPPSERVPAGGMWNPGIPGGIPERTVVCQTLNPTGDSTDRTAEINNAIDNCGYNEKSCNR